MIPPRNPNYRAALAAAHLAYSRVEVWRAGLPVQELSVTSTPAVSSLANVAKGAPVFLGGSVRATLSSRVTRTLTLSVPDWLYPWGNGDLLAPWGNELRAYRGIRYGTGEVDEFQVFRGPITSAQPQGTGLVTVNAGDRAQDVVGSDFAAPTTANVGALIPVEFKRLIRAALPDATFGAFSPITATVPALSYDYDRGAALDGLAQVAGCYWYTLAGGDFVLRFIPWSVPVTTGSTILTNVGGSLLTAMPTRSRDNVFNRVTVSNEPTNGAPPTYATADDTDPTSPTYILGPYGVKATQVRITQAATQAGCRTAAQAILARSKALTQAWTLTCVPDGSLELGDPLGVRYLDTSNTLRASNQLIGGYTIPLDMQSPTMSIDGRAPLAGDQPQ